MKKVQINPALAALNRIRVTMIEDKGLRDQVITTHVALLEEQQNFRSAMARLKKAHLAGYDNELDAMQALERDRQAAADDKEKARIQAELDKHVDVLKAFDAYKKAIAELGMKEIKVPGLPKARFLAAIQDQIEDLGMLEALFPLFVNKE